MSRQRVRAAAFFCTSLTSENSPEKESGYYCCWAHRNRGTDLSSAMTTAELLACAVKRKYSRHDVPMHQAIRSKGWLATPTQAKKSRRPPRVAAAHVVRRAVAGLRARLGGRPSTDPNFVPTFRAVYHTQISLRGNSVTRIHRPAHPLAVQQYHKQGDDETRHRHNSAQQCSSGASLVTPAYYSRRRCATSGGRR